MMTLTVPYVALLIMAFSFFAIVQMRMKRVSPQARRTVTRMISTLRILIEHVPKHRGMANAFLSGDDKFKKPMQDTQRIIADNIAELTMMARDLNSTYITKRVRACEEDWERLAREVYTLNAPTSFQRHTNLIESLIHTGEDLAGDFELAASDGPGMKFMVETTSQGLPRLTDAMGQLRGIGTGAAAKGHIDVGTRVKLKYLHDYVRKQSDLTFSSLPANFDELHASFKQAQQKTSEFLDTLRKQLIEAREITVGSEEYYNQATEIIGHNLVLFDKILPIITKQIEIDVKSAQRKTRLVTGVNAILCVCACVATYYMLA